MNEEGSCPACPEVEVKGKVTDDAPVKRKGASARLFSLTLG
jgi:hypothetical protein